MSEEVKVGFKIPAKLIANIAKIVFIVLILVFNAVYFIKHDVLPPPTEVQSQAWIIGLMYAILLPVDASIFVLNLSKGAKSITDSVKGVK